MSGLAYDYPRRWQVPAHSHDFDQLIYAMNGIMSISVAQTNWLIPPQFAVWIPSQVIHSILMTQAVAMRTVYIRPGLVKRISCAALHVPPLLRELVFAVIRSGQVSTRRQPDSALALLLVKQIESSSPIPTNLDLSTDARARRIANAVLENHSATHKLESMCQDLGVSVRTLQRLFRKEVGMDFETWRRQARFIKAIELLLAGQSVKQIAAAVGYRHANTFVQAFRSVFELPPKSWLESLMKTNNEIRNPQAFRTWSTST